MDQYGFHIHFPGIEHPPIWVDLSYVAEPDRGENRPLVVIYPPGDDAEPLAHIRFKPDETSLELEAEDTSGIHKSREYLHTYILKKGYDNGR
jgi:hypothetical protein